MRPRTSLRKKIIPLLQTLQTAIVANSNIDKKPYVKMRERSSSMLGRTMTTSTMTMSTHDERRRKRQRMRRPD